MVSSFIKELTNPEVAPLFITFLTGYVFLRVSVEKEKIRIFSDFEQGIIASGIGILINYFFTLPLLMIFFYWSSLNSQINIVNFSYIINFFLALPVLYYRINKHSEIKIRELISKTLLYYVLFFSSLNISNIIIGALTINWYESNIYENILDNWTEYAGFNAFALIMNLLFFRIVNVFLLKPFGTPLSTLNLTKKKMTIKSLFMIPIILMSVILIPLDNNYNLFTPEVITTQTTNRQWRVLNIIAELEYNQPPSSHYDLLYELNIKRTIHYPRFFPLIKTLFFSNPSEIEYWDGNSLQDHDFWHSSDKIAFYVDETYFHFFRSEKNIAMNELVKKDGVSINLTRSLRSSYPHTISYGYWQNIPVWAHQEDNIQITVLNPIIKIVNNSTQFEKYTYIIHNNADILTGVFNWTLTDSFNFNYINKTSLNVYLNDVRFPAEISDRTLFTSGYPIIPSNSIGNYTITFIRAGSTEETAWMYPLYPSS